MSLEFALCEEPELLITLISGRVDNDEYCAGYRRILNADSYRPGTPELVLFHSDCSFHVSVNSLAYVAGLAQDCDQGKASNTAVMVTNPLLGAIGMIYTIIASGIDSREQVRMFNALTPALGWLECPRDGLPAWVDERVLEPTGLMPCGPAEADPQRGLSIV